MSESIRRKSSSRQLLQNLIRVTAQRSQEDAEEVERERRRRARERQREEESPTWPEPPQHNELEHNMELEDELKPSCSLVLEEDEGFSDWTHKLENRTEQEVPEDCRVRLQRSSAPQGKQSSTAQHKPEPEDEKQRDDAAGCEPDRQECSQAASVKPSEKASSSRQEVRTSYSSTVFLPQDVRLPDRTSYLVAGTMKPRKNNSVQSGAACRADAEVEQEDKKEEEDVQASLQREWRLDDLRQSHRDQEDQEEEELSFTHEESDNVHVSRKETYMEEEEEEEEYKMTDERSAEGRRSEEESRRSTVSVSSSSEGEDSLNCYGPMSPTFKKLLIQFYPDEANSRISTDGRCKIIERTESLRKSTSNTKKTLPPVPVHKINKKLEEYTHALEVSSKEGRPGAQVLMDLASPSEPVSSKKNLFEAGEAWNQNAISVTPSKDADGLKVGVANLINQWVRGGEDASRCSSPSRPAEGSAGKKYKFVVTGHGKYEKVSVDHDCSEDANDQESDGHFYEDL